MPREEIELAEAAQSGAPLPRRQSRGKNRRAQVVTFLKTENYSIAVLYCYVTMPQIPLFSTCLLHLNSDKEERNKASAVICWIMEDLHFTVISLQRLNTFILNIIYHPYRFKHVHCVCAIVA